MHKHLVLFVALLSLASSIAYAGVDEGIDAYNRGYAQLPRIIKK